MGKQKKQQCNSLGNNSVKIRRVDKAFEPYRQAFIHGDIQQQSYIINEFVSSLVAAEYAKLTEERGYCMEKCLPIEEIFTCNLCRELLHVPVTLVCGHTFCLECLGNYEREGRTMCPGCGQESNLHYTSNIVVRELSRICFPEKTSIRNCIVEANNLLRERKMEEFMELTKNLLTKYPENVDLLHLRANGYQCLKSYSDALNVLDFACTLAPFCTKVLYARGELLASIDEPEEAMVMFLRASALKPNDLTYRGRLTSCLEKPLRNICNSSELCSPSSSYNADHEATTKRVLKGLPVKSEPNFDESTTTAQNMSRRRPACINEDGQVGHRNVAVTMNSNEHAFTTDSTDHRGDPTCRTDATEKTVDTLMDQDRSCYKKEETKNISQCQRVSCIQRNIIVPPKSNIPSELECKLCFNLLYEPVTTSCGHSFCRACLERCLDHRFHCPCCRTNLQSYLEHFIMKNVGTCKVLESLCLLKFKDEYQTRRLAYEKELLDFSRCESNKDEIPIFVCTLAVPDIACPLHIFEPRYKLMIRRCIESGSRQFGMCAPDPEQTFATVGTMLHINDVNFLPDGRSVVHTVGSRRFQVLERGLQDGYNTAKVAWLQDECDESDYTKLNCEVYNMMIQWFEKLPSEQKICIVKAVGRLPDALQGTNENGPSWLWWLLVAMPLNHEAKQIILSMTSITERLNSAKRFLAILLSRL
ncbi:LON peptidase N-terminal domain and RING finger 3-like [Paramuricea clavata]|nr:LON peptidase N-terminal domain and RING finger 3-like [Paramuricea clavata]